MADYGIGIILILVYEFFGTREGYLIDILINILFGHTDTAVAYSQRTFFLID